MFGEYVTWENRFAELCASFADAIDHDELKVHYDLRELIRDKADAMRFVSTTRRVIRELSYAADWAEELINCQ